MGIHGGESFFKAAHERFLWALSHQPSTGQLSLSLCQLRLTERFDWIPEGFHFQGPPLRISWQLTPRGQKLFELLLHILSQWRFKSSTLSLLTHQMGELILGLPPQLPRNLRPLPARLENRGQRLLGLAGIPCRCYAPGSGQRYQAGVHEFRDGVIPHLGHPDQLLLWDTKGVVCDRWSVAEIPIVGIRQPCLSVAHPTFKGGVNRLIAKAS